MKKNIVYQASFDVISMIVPLLTSPYLARVVGAEGLGIYSYHYTIAYYFNLLAALGMLNHGNRSIAKCRDNQKELDSTFSNLFAIQATTSVICIIMYIIFALFISNPSERIYDLILLPQVISSFFDISWFYFGTENFRFTVSVNAIVKALNLVAIFVFVKTSNDLWLYFIIMSLGIFTSQIALWIPLKKYVSFVRPELIKMSYHFKPLFVLFLPTIAVSLYKFMDKIMIGVMSNKSQLGFYENAEKVITLPLTIIASFGTVMIPRISNMLANNEQKDSIRYTKASSLYVMALAYALAFGFASTGNVFAPVYWGDGFELSGRIIMGLSITIPFISFANIIRTQYLIPNERDKEIVISSSFGALINLIINILLIPSMGAYGATIGTIAAEILVCCIQCLSVRRSIPLWDIFRQSLPFLIFGGVMFAIVYWIGAMRPTTVITLIIQIFIGILIYCTESIIYLWINKDSLLLSLINRINTKRP